MGTKRFRTEKERLITKKESGKGIKKEVKKEIEKRN